MMRDKPSNDRVSIAAVLSKIVATTIVLWLTYWLVLSPDSLYRRPRELSNPTQPEPVGTADAMQAFCALSEAGNWNFGESEWDFATRAFDSDDAASAALVDTKGLPLTAAPAEDFTDSLFALIDAQAAEFQEVGDYRCRRVENPMAKMALFTDLKDQFVALRLLQGTQPNLQMISIAWHGKRDDPTSFIPVPKQTELVAQRSREGGQLAARVLRTSAAQWVLNARWRDQGWTIEKDPTTPGRWIASKDQHVFSLIRSEQESGEATIIVVKML